MDIGTEVRIIKLDLNRALMFGYSLGDEGVIVKGSSDPEPGNVWVHVDGKAHEGEGIRFALDEIREITPDEVVETARLAMGAIIMQGLAGMLPPKTEDEK